MDMQLIPYGGSKAVKITEEMRGGLNSYNQRREDVANYDKEIAELEAERGSKNAEIETLNSSIEGEDKKEAKEVSKQIKAIEKEISKIDANIKSIVNKRDKLVAKHEEVSIEGVVLNMFSESEDQALEVAEEAEEEAFEPATEESFESELEDTNDEETGIENATEEADLSDELDDDFAAELNDDFVVDDSSLEDGNGEFALSEEDANQIWEGLQNIELNDIPNGSVTPDYSEEVIEPVYEDASEENNDQPVIEEPEISTEEIQEEVHNEIEEAMPSVEAIVVPDSEDAMNSVYNEVDVTPEEEVKSEVRDLTQLTLFDDYADYVFEYARQHYNKEAFTPIELEALNEIKEFLSKKLFETRRATQYKKIADESKKLKKKVTTLGKEFKKNVEVLSKDYEKSVDEFSKAALAAKEQAEADRVEKVQTQKLNESLTATINEQESSIENLTKANEDLQKTIDKQKEQISDLKKENKDQAKKLKELEEKFNTVFGIVKEVSGEK